jgi:hypothetical protein
MQLSAIDVYDWKGIGSNRADWDNVGGSPKQHAATSARLAAFSPERWEVFVDQAAWRV